jgi:hypothetical protein
MGTTKASKKVVKKKVAKKKAVKRYASREEGRAAIAKGKN